MSEAEDRSARALAVAMARLRRVTAIESGIKGLRRRVDDIARKVTTSILAQVDAFNDSANPRILPLLAQHVDALVAEYLQLLDGAQPRPPAFVERYAREAAEHYFPLEALLHAYRVCMRQLLHITTAALLQSSHRDGVAIVTAATDFVLEFVNVMSTLATEHYLDQSRLLADVASDQRSELFALLLGGYDESDRRVSAILRDAGYLDRRLRFCVVLAQSIDPTEMHNAARARRLAEYVDQLLSHLSGNRLIDIHRNKVTIVFSQQHRLSGWSAPRPSLANRIAQEMMKIGPAARLGVSNDVDSTAQIPSAYRQASLAFDRSSVSRRVVQFADIPLQQLLINFAHEEFTRVLPAWTQAFVDADAHNERRFSNTLNAYADNGMNLLKTARQLGVHANTVYARFDRILTLTGRDPRGFDALNELLIVAASQKM